MKQNFVDCFMLMSMALSLNGGKKLTEMGRPLLHEPSPTVVNVSLTVQDFKFVDVKNMEIQVDLVLHQRWIDSRLGANAKTRKMAVAGQIWKPKLTNINGVATNCFHNSEDTIFWRGYGPEGNVLLSEKVLVNTYCTTDLERFPFDVQYCELKFGTYRFPKEEVELIWDRDPMQMLIDSNLKEFTLTNVTIYTSIDARPSGNFTILVLQFALKRHGWHYVLCSGFPSVLVIFLCYLTFWIEKEHHAVRYVLNMFCLCVLFYIYNTSACSLLAVPYMKASDIFISLCICFALISMMETFVIDMVLRAKSIDVKIVTGSFERAYPKTVVWIERCMRLAFPVFYLFFVLFYCLVYVTVQL